MSVVARFSGVEPAGGPVMTAFYLFRAPAEYCIVTCSMAVVAFLGCCRAVTLRVFVATFHALGVVHGDSILMH